MQTQSSKSDGMPLKDALKMLRVSADAPVETINQAYKSRLAELQRKYLEQPDKLVRRADELYAAYRAAYEAKEGANRDDMLPLTITGPDTLLNMFDISDVPHSSMKVQTQSQAHYRDGQLVRKESNRTESFVNSDGKRETKVFENGKLVRHTIDGKEV